MQHFVPFDVLSHSAFITFDITVCLFGILSHSAFCPIRHFVCSTFCIIRHFVIRHFVPFDVLSFDVLYFWRLLLRHFVGEPTHTDTNIIHTMLNVVSAPICLRWVRLLPLYSLSLSEWERLQMTSYSNAERRDEDIILFFKWKKAPIVLRTKVQLSISWLISVNQGQNWV